MSSSTEIIIDDENENIDTNIHYIYDESQFSILNTSEIGTELMGDIIYTNGNSMENDESSSSTITRAILVDGQYFIPTPIIDNQAIYLETQDEIEEDIGDAKDNHLTQYYIENSDISTNNFIIEPANVSFDNATDEEININGTDLGTTAIVQLAKIETDNIHEQQIFYFNSNNNNNNCISNNSVTNEEQLLTTMTQCHHHDDDNEEIDGVPIKRLKIMTDDSCNNDSNEQYEYAFVDDDLNNYQICYYNPAVNIINDDDDDDATTSSSSTALVDVDLSKITGRNLLTGQTITLDSQAIVNHHHQYCIDDDLSSAVATATEDSEQESSSSSSNQLLPLSDLIDRKIAIGKTRNGKKIVGKIIHVGKKIIQDCPTEMENQQVTTVSTEQLLKQSELEITQDTADPLVLDESSSSSLSSSSMSVTSLSPKCRSTNATASSSTTTKQQIVMEPSSPRSENYLNVISKTLSGLMDMESIRKKLEAKNIVVKLVQKQYSHETNGFVKNNFYSYGYLIKEFNHHDHTDDDTMNRGGDIKWRFIVDRDTRDALLEANGDKKTKYPSTITITIIISHDRNDVKTVKVNMNPSHGSNNNNNRCCLVCTKLFANNQQMRMHMREIHTNSNNTTHLTTLCDICGVLFKNVKSLHDHQRQHISEGRLFLCGTCNEVFLSRRHLKKHNALMHAADASSSSSQSQFLYDCMLCEYRCVNKSQLKKHLLTTHTLTNVVNPSSLYSCTVCKKEFDNPYDRSEHRKVHFPPKQFSCGICMRTFSRYSNLQRHIQIHQGNEASYKCDICDCSYKFASSLTRHKVQSHLETKN